jgi:hypothetical protein
MNSYYSPTFITSSIRLLASSSIKRSYVVNPYEVPFPSTVPRLIALSSIKRRYVVNPYEVPLPSTEDCR